MAATLKEEEDFMSPQNVQHPGYDFSYMDNQRRPKFTKSELEALVSGVAVHRNELLPPNGGPAYRSTNAARQNCWKDILDKINAVSDPDVTRTLPEVVKRWRYLKSRTRVKARRMTRFDNGLSELQRRVMDVVGGSESVPEEENDEDGWDEVYEIDVGDVTVGDVNEDEFSEQGIPKKSENNSAVYASAKDMDVTLQPFTSSPTVDQLVNNNNITVEPFHTKTIKEQSMPGRGKSTVNIEKPSTDAGGRNPPGHYERAPPLETKHSNNPNFCSGLQSERLADKNNVNITVQSCSCHHGNQTKTAESEALEIQKERLEVEKQRLEIERQRLQIERERLELEKRKAL